MIFHQSLIRVRPGWRETRGGDLVEDWSTDAVTRTMIDRLSIQPNAQDETASETGTRRTTGYRVISEPGTTPDFASTDRAEYQGSTYTVEGEVALWPSPFGDDHIEFAMIRHKGA